MKNNNKDGNDIPIQNNTAEYIRNKKKFNIRLITRLEEINTKDKALENIVDMMKCLIDVVECQNFILDFIDEEIESRNSVKCSDNDNGYEEQIKNITALYEMVKEQQEKTDKGLDNLHEYIEEEIAGIEKDSIDNEFVKGMLFIYKKIMLKIERIE